VDTYWTKAASDFPTAVTICVLAKQAFIKNAESRFNILESYYRNIRYYDESGANFVLLAEYIRLLMVDALMLGRYDFLHKSVSDVAELLKFRKPRFLGDEYILANENELYRFDEGNTGQNLRRFLRYSTKAWGNSRHAARFKRIAHISSDRYVNIELDPVTGFYIRAPRQEIAVRLGNARLDFAIKYAPDGFFAVNFN